MSKDGLDESQRQEIEEKIDRAKILYQKWREQNFDLSDSLTEAEIENWELLLTEHPEYSDAKWSDEEIDLSHLFVTGKTAASTTKATRSSSFEPSQTAGSRTLPKKSISHGTLRRFSSQEKEVRRSPQGASVLKDYYPVAKASSQKPQRQMPTVPGKGKRTLVRTTTQTELTGEKIDEISRQAKQRAQKIASLELEIQDLKESIQESGLRQTSLKKLRNLDVQEKSATNSNTLIKAMLPVDKDSRSSAFQVSSSKTAPVTILKSKDKRVKSKPKKLTWNSSTIVKSGSVRKNQMPSKFENFGNTATQSKKIIKQTEVAEINEVRLRSQIFELEGVIRRLQAEVQENAAWQELTTDLQEEIAQLSRQKPVQNPDLEVPASTASASNVEALDLAHQNTKDYP